jgi:FixJ family two-component response regulator
MAERFQSIVVVEDDDGMRRAIQRLLRAAGFNAVVFSSAEALLEADAADSAGCLVFDIHLPGLSGFELQRRLSTAGHKAPVIFITAHDDASVREEAEQLDCIGYFRKPFEGSSLLEAIRRALNIGA